MEIAPDDGYHIAREVINRFAPHEEKIFDVLWEEYIDNPERPLDEAERSDHEMGSGSEQEIVLLSALVIPIVVSVITNAVNKSVDVIIEMIREKQNKKRKKILQEEDAKRMAQLIIELANQQQGKNARKATKRQ